jgi:hypothetical protein
MGKIKYLLLILILISDKIAMLYGFLPGIKEVHIDGKV